MITERSAWDATTIIAAARPLAVARGLAGAVYIEHAADETCVRIEFLRASTVTCSLTISVDELEACADRAAVTALIERDVATPLRTRHAGAAA